MRNSLFIARMDLLHMLRSREAIVWIFVMPIVFFFFIGNVTSNMGAALMTDTYTPDFDGAASTLATAA